MKKSGKSTKLFYLTAAVILTIIFCLAFFSVRDDSLTFDETAHIGAGYSYLSQKDMRLNPEHPPLVKDLAALPLLFLNLDFPKNDPAWLQPEAPHWWLQFDLGHRFIYQNAVSPEKIIFWSRLPIIFLLIIFAGFVFYWSKKLFGDKAGLLALFLFAFSPTLLAHGRYVTTDVPAAFGVALAIFCWLNFLKNPNKKNIFFAGLAFALSLLIKFSAILLIPFFALITIACALLKPDKKIKNLFKYLLLSCCVGLIALLLIWPVYQLHIQNLPAERQIRDTKLVLENSVIPDYLVKTNIWLSGNKITRGLGHFLFGILMAVNRSSTGNAAYFLGKISGQGFKTYFPIIYALKEPLAFHILTIIALLFAAASVIANSAESGAKQSQVDLDEIASSPAAPRNDNNIAVFRNDKKGTFSRDFIKKHFAELSILLFIIIYWLTSINAKLNIGVRHLLPVIPLTIILVSGAISRWLNPCALPALFRVIPVKTGIQTQLKYTGFPIRSDRAQADRQGTEGVGQGAKKRTTASSKLKIALIFGLILWQAISVMIIYPHFLAYFNEAVAGPKNGYLYATDSNLDWGQDLKRLKEWIDRYNTCADKTPLCIPKYRTGEIDKIYIDYFGGGDLDYYLDDKYIKWDSRAKPTELPPGSFLAVSVNQLQGGRAEPAKDYDQPTDYYRWLDNYQPVAQIGYSIFVYYIK